MVRNILHCDMNNFYASVECMLNPKLKNHPVAVCGSVEERHGIVLAKNYEAKAFNVKTGDAVWQAKEKCPKLIVVEPHYNEYVKYANYAREIYYRYSEFVEPYGMDECWLDISGTEKIFGTPFKVANEIRETVKRELGLTISVGVSFNKVFAKLGSDMKKPDAVTEIPFENFRDIIWNLPASDMLGVGRATQATLNNFGIHTIGQLANFNPDILEKRLGKCGLSIWQYANGLDYSDVKNKDFQTPIKSIGHGTTTVRDMKNNEDVWLIVLELTQEIGHKLKEHKKSSTTVCVTVRDCDLHIEQFQTKLSLPTQSPTILSRAAFELFKKRYIWLRPLRSVTVRAADLISQDEPFQMSLFSDIEKLEKLEKLDNCIEVIRGRFGNDSIVNASLCKASVFPTEHIEMTMPTGMV